MHSAPPQAGMDKKPFKKYGGDLTLTYIKRKIKGWEKEKSRSLVEASISIGIKQSLKESLLNLWRLFKWQIGLQI